MKEIQYPEEYIELRIDEAMALYETAKEEKEFVICGEVKRKRIEREINRKFSESSFKEYFLGYWRYPEPKEYLLELVSKHLKPIIYDPGAELYWKKQLEEELPVTEERELEKLEKEDLRIIEGVYGALSKDKGIQEQIERIKEHMWTKVVKSEDRSYTHRKL